MTAPLVSTAGLTKHFPLARSLAESLTRAPHEYVHAVDGVTFELNQGETLGLIGESGSGKTTLGWLLAKLHEPTGGTITFDGTDITDLHGADLVRWRSNVQVVFQDPVGSLDPRMRVWQIVGEPLQAQERSTKAELRAQVAELLPLVGLPAGTLDQYPHEFSGGGRQRLSLARALSVKPKLIVLDEPTSALDVAVQAQVLNRLVTLQEEMGLSYLLITHNVAAVRYVADRVAVMYLGQIVEVGRVKDLLERPVHPYTKALLAALPEADPRRRRTRYRITGEIPTLIHPPPGCRFAARCPFAVDECRTTPPPLREVPQYPGRQVACLRAEEIGDVPPAQLLATESEAGSIPAPTP